MLLVIILSLLFVGYLLFKYQDILLLFPGTPFGYRKLKEQLISNGFNYSLKHHLLSIFALIIGVCFVASMFMLNIYFMSLLILIACSSLPFMILWHHQFLRQESYFNNLVTYGQHFIASFKHQPKVLQALNDTLQVLENPAALVILKAIKSVRRGDDINIALAYIACEYPHFIINNLHVLVSAVELNGAVDYLPSLDLLQSDIDDLLEDVNAFKHKQLRLQKHLKILIVFALALALLVKNMLLEITINTETPIYQITTFIFLLLILITFLMSQRIYQKPWLNKQELVC